MRASRAPPEVSSKPSPDAIAAAKAAHLKYVCDDKAGIRRKLGKNGFIYIGADGKILRDRKELTRIRKLAVPPAYEDVWICPDPDGHLQATGRDQRGRKQYRYHPRWREVRDANKYDEILEFGRLLPQLRKRILEDLRLRGLAREKVLAAVVTLLDRTLIRVGNSAYAKENKSYGLTTLHTRHVAIEGATLRFEFRGKSGKAWKLKVHDRRIARVVKACHDLPGQELFQYVGEQGEPHPISSEDVNAYLKEISGHDFTAKHFRTWAGTVLAAIALSQCEIADRQTLAKRFIKQAIESVAKRLGNTQTICRKCYVHPEVIAAYLDGDCLASSDVDPSTFDDAELSSQEQALIDLLERRLAKSLPQQSKLSSSNKKRARRVRRSSTNPENIDNSVAA
jgi:DNA topoisomerase-1